MRTNFQMIRELDGFVPEHRGMLTGEEVSRIKSTLCIEEMDELALRNLRDFTVMFYSNKVDHLEDNGWAAWKEQWDIMSAVTGVIDNQLWSIGAEV